MNFKSIGQVVFPEPQDICINMMPFVMGDINSIPEEFRHYYPLIEACDLSPNQMGKVGYLSITESQVVPGTSHRRGGAHVEKQPITNWGNGGWGRGNSRNGVEDGLYIASTVDNSCRVWDQHIFFPGWGGCCEHLRSILKNGIDLKANELAWITDSCPHESLPLADTVYRQWFRLVTHKVDLWFADKSTENRLGVKAPCMVV